MIQETALRTKLDGAEAPLLICGEDHRFIIAEQMQAVGIAPRGIVLEPEGRNTAPAAAVAALLTSEVDPQGIVLLLPSDHIVDDRAAFAGAVEKAVTAAKQGSIVTFGIEPDSPETGYGYIQRGDATEGAFRVKRFAEKPEASKAAEYVASGDHYWNSGMFVFRADIMLAELALHAPGIVEGCKKSISAAKRDLDFIRLDADSYAGVDSISIDYAVMERTAVAAVVPCKMGWNDVGAWSSLWAIQQRDAAGNVFQGDVLVHNTHDSFVRSDKGLTALVGVKDLVVVVTDDAVLVADKRRAQDVKEIVGKLKSMQRTEHVEHKTVFRPWGSYQSIDSGNGFPYKCTTTAPSIGSLLRARRASPAMTMSSRFKRINRPSFPWARSIGWRTQGRFPCALSKFNPARIWAKTILSGLTTSMAERIPRLSALRAKPVRLAKVLKDF
jgi:mannose-1-phosphate guanylyltransferase/mannose-6-phosphate isomerase